MGKGWNVVFFAFGAHKWCAGGAVNLAEGRVRCQNSELVEENILLCRANSSLNGGAVQGRHYIRLVTFVYLKLNIHNNTIQNIFYL
jgi:hypothetical protein